MDPELIKSSLVVGIIVIGITLIGLLFFRKNMFEYLGMVLFLIVISLLLISSYGSIGISHSKMSPTYSPARSERSLVSARSNRSEGSEGSEQSRISPMNYPPKSEESEGSEQSGGPDNVSVVSSNGYQGGYYGMEE